MAIIILAIETSCDDTCAAIVKAGGRKRPRFDILSDVRSSQVKIHAPYGGVVPNLAARAHLENMGPVLKQCFRNADLQIENGKSQVDLITVTTHPGLIPCLLIGTNVARTLAWIWDKPIVGANHLEGHIYANWVIPVGIKEKLKMQKAKIRFPAMCLIVSGGHTQLVLIKHRGDFKIIGETLDDAAGEAFDKVARLLGLSFPGGPQIERLAQSAQNIAESIQMEPISSRRPSQTGRRQSQKKLLRDSAWKPQLPRPMINSKDYDFSFSGLKTAVLYLVQDLQKSRKAIKLYSSKAFKARLCYEFQQAVIDVLIAKTIKAAKNYKAKTVILGGGVGANQELRRQLQIAVEEKLSNVNCQMSNIKYCTDNAVIIAIAGYFRYLEGKTKTWKNIIARATL